MKELANLAEDVKVEVARDVFKKKTEGADLDGFLDVDTLILIT